MTAPRKGGGKPPGEIVLAVLALLAEHTWLTRSELCRLMGRDRHAVASVMSRMSRTWPNVGKRIYVAGYVHEDDGSRRYPRPFYALGDRRDTPKPKPDRNDVLRRYRARVGSRK